MARNTIRLPAVRREHCTDDTASRCRSSSATKTRYHELRCPHVRFVQHLLIKLVFCVLRSDAQQCVERIQLIQTPTTSVDPLLLGVKRKLLAHLHHCDVIDTCQEEITISLSQKRFGILEITFHFLFQFIVKRFQLVNELFTLN